MVRRAASLRPCPSASSVFRLMPAPSASSGTLVCHSNRLRPLYLGVHPQTLAGRIIWKVCMRAHVSACVCVHVHACLCVCMLPVCVHACLLESRHASLCSDVLLLLNTLPFQGRYNSLKSLCVVCVCHIMHVEVRGYDSWILHLVLRQSSKLLLLP